MRLREITFSACEEEPFLIAYCSAKIKLKATIAVAIDKWLRRQFDIKLRLLKFYPVECMKWGGYVLIVLLVATKIVSAAAPV